MVVASIEDWSIVRSEVFEKTNGDFKDEKGSYIAHESQGTPFWFCPVSKVRPGTSIAVDA